MVSLQPPKPILPDRPGTELHAGIAQLEAHPGGVPQPILPKRSDVRSQVGQPQSMPKPILPARGLAGAGGRSGVIQGSFAGGRPRVPVRAPRPGQKGTFQLKAAAPLGNATPLPDDFAGVRSFAPGKRMAPTIQAKMESVFGTSFGDVRIHEGTEASSIGALAFTQGSSIYFAPGQYNPNTPQGQRLLGQQLAHVVQQRSGRVRNPFGAGTAVVQDPLLKAEAEMMGSRAAMAQSIQPRSQKNGFAVGSAGQISHLCESCPTGRRPARHRRPRRRRPVALADRADAPGSHPAEPGRSAQRSPAPILPGRALSGPSTAGRGDPTQAQPSVPWSPVVENSSTPLSPRSDAGC